MKYQLKRVKKSRSIRVRLSTDNQVIVTAPPYIPQIEIDGFVEQSKPWVERQMQRLKLRQTAYPTIDWDQKVVSYLGKLYRIEFKPDAIQKVTVTPTHILIAPVTLQVSDVPKTLLSWLQLEAEKLIRPLVESWAKVMDTEYQTVSFGQQISRWGSCSGDNKLQFNWRLVHFPQEVIEYVVVHELTHTIHHNHSEQFWRMVEKYCPNYKDRKRFLKQQLVAKV